MIKQQVIAEQGITIEQLEARILKATCLIEEQKHLLQSEKEHVREREL